MSVFNSETCDAKFEVISKQSGAGLIEVLVSLLILAVGLLGVLSLQANGLNSTQRAEFVGEAQVLAQDMADRILAYGSRVSNSNYGANNDFYDATNTLTNTYADPGCIAAGCDPSSTDDFDKFQWRRAISDSSLPRAYGTVSWASPVYTITVRWDQDRTGATGLNCNSNDKSSGGNLTCFEMHLRLYVPPP